MLTIRGMVKYGLQLTVVELSTIAAIYMIRLIIDYLHEPMNSYQGYSIVLFTCFTLSRLIAILVRNYYDLHVYNHYRFIQTAVQAWIYEDIQNIKLWSKIGAEETKEGLEADKQLKDSEA